MFIFNRVEVYIGYSMDELSKVREVLKSKGIKYTYKVIDQSAQWRANGTTRGNFGSIGITKNYENQYVVYVKKKDAENAKYFIHSVLHS
ncbi:hypothetical protein SPD48_01490 [Pseudogracilibacillus sp. SE30717A]|uniref:hypothetical protein n=1 Tax=Pseudogracilibacillus sp. SE30717A TaxID=3098293 RepID=UPI00300DE273